MATLRDYYNTGDDSSELIYPASEWLAQVFQASLSYDIKSVKLYLYRDGDPGNITVSIRATDEDEKPDGIDLTSETILGTSFTDVTRTWVEFTFDTPYSLINGTKYAIVCRSAGNGGVFAWRNDGTSPTYTDGHYVSSANSGGTWYPITTGIDFMFETYDAFSPPVDIVTIKKLVAAANNKIWYEDI